MDTSEGLDIVNELLGLNLMETTPAIGPCEEYKGWKPTEEGRVNKFYLSASDCSLLSEAFAKLADNLKQG
jgi:hypothetical protein